MINEIYNEDCFLTMKKMVENKVGVDTILTSPFYNTNVKAGKKGVIKKKNNDYYEHVRYDVHVDNMTGEEYEEFTVKLFDSFDKVLKKDGVVLYNLSYGASGANEMIGVLSSVIKETNFKLVDIITWKKPNAMPNNCSPNRLTRIVEYIYVFCRNEESKTFISNKEHVSTRKNGQKMYGNITNFIEAKNNDGSCGLNKATYSSELCNKLLNIYGTNGGVVYDPFMGTGTTAVSSILNNMKYIGSEISDAQCNYSRKRIKALEV